MKFLAYVFVFALFSCASESWTSEEQAGFKESCIQEGGSKKYCKCLMENTMNQYPRYEESKLISFEEMVEITTECQ